MFHAAVTHAPNDSSARLRDTFEYLIQWLLENGVDVASARFGENDSDDTLRSLQNKSRLSG